jgi:Skp family chaperone for outer membrane proteins
MKFKYVTAISGLLLSASLFAAVPASSDQAAITALQQQIAAIQTETKTALAAQQAQTQKALSDMQTQIQTQIAHIQTEMQQLQVQLTNEIKMVQDQALKASTGAPVVTATPGVTAPAAKP